MKLRITFKYILTIILVVVIVTTLNLIALISLVIGMQQGNHYQPQESFVREFSTYLKESSGNIYVNDKGRNLLDSKNNWIQILDENGKEVYNYNKPVSIKTKHTPMELINGYKYAGGLSKNNSDNILVGDKNINNINYTYIVGFEKNKLEKIIYTYSTYNLVDTFRKTTIWIFIADIIIAIVFGYIFSKRLINPMKTIINGVDNLEEGKYDIYYKERGLYKAVYKKLNNLSDTLKQSEIERKKIDNMRQEWIANISHDIKTPLSSIKGYAELLSSEYEFSREEIYEYGEIINSKSEYIKELVDDLNLTMKLKNNDSILNKEDTNLVRLLKDSIIEILNDPRYCDIDIDFICDKSIIKIDVDKSLIRRVINNLLYNAIVHNDKNISIVVKLYEVDDVVNICISDDGKGISKEDLKYIFDRYYRGTNTGEAHKGSGLGMAIAKEIILAHGGSIDIESDLDNGTSILIKL